MKFIPLVFLYMIASGLLLGAVKNRSNEACGEPQKISNEDVAAVLLWPVAVGAAITIDEIRDFDSCDKKSKG